MVEFHVSSPVKNNSLKTVKALHGLPLQARVFSSRVFSAALASGQKIRHPQGTFLFTDFVFIAVKHRHIMTLSLLAAFCSGAVAVGLWMLTSDRNSVSAGERIMATDISGDWIISEARGMDLSNYGDLKLHFDGGKLYGKSPCRSFNAEYRLDGQHLTILRPDVFGGLCDEEKMDAESKFFSLLSVVEDASIDEAGQLVFKGFGQEVLRAKSQTR
ncbi:META domain-containing protein [Pseudophaeobacter sp.]|uniref:META domain-containing protein n=1 Tax=Pseudophaeobacter sp. TaxID=1971739 RepID=UPI003299C3F5